MIFYSTKTEYFFVFWNNKEEIGFSLLYRIKTYYYIICFFYYYSVHVLIN